MNRRQFLAAGLGAAFAPLALAEPADAVIVTNPSPRRYGPVGLIGDSLSGGNIPQLRRMLVEHEVGPFRLDIVGGRSMTISTKTKPSGVRAIGIARAAGFDPPAWFIGLGGNDLAAFRAGRRDPYLEITKVLDELGPVNVAWPTIARQFRSWWPVAQLFNDTLHQLALERPNLHVIEWADLLNQHNPKWYKPGDNAHLRSAGVVARNEMTVQAMILVADAS